MDEARTFSTEELCALRAGVSVICGAKRDIEQLRAKKEAFELYDLGCDLEDMDREGTDPDVYRYFKHIYEVESNIQYYNNLPKTIVDVQEEIGGYPYGRQNYNYRASSCSSNHTLEIMKKILAIIVGCIALLFLAVFVYAIVSPQVTDTFAVTMTGIGGFVVCAAMLIPLVATRNRTSKAAETSEYGRRVKFTEYNIVYAPEVMHKQAEFAALKQKIDEDREFIEKHLEEKAKEEGEKSRLAYRALVEIFGKKGVDESMWANIDALISEAEKDAYSGQGGEVSFADVYTTTGTARSVCLYQVMTAVYDEYAKICERECGSSDESVCFTLGAFSTALGTEKDRSSKDLVAILDDVKKAGFAF